MVDAEWLLKSHRELLGVEKALQRRIKQLKMEDNENDVIESMELGTIQEPGMPRAQSRFGSKTERAASDFREKAAEEKKAEARRAQKEAQEKRIRDGKNQRDEHATERVNKTDEASEADWENTVTITASSIGELLKKISDYQQNERMNTVQTKEERLVGGHIDYKG